MEIFPPHKVVLHCKDHLVSGEEYSLLYEEKYEMLITHPQPGADNLPKYYESERYISHTDAKRSWFEKMYGEVKKYALRKKVRLINRLHPEQGNLLDIGAGTGDFLVKAKQKGWEVHGTEPNEKARRMAAEKGIGLHSSTPHPGTQQYDVIALWHVLEHIPDTVAQLTELKRLLKPGGTLLIAVPNFRSYDATHYGAYWAAYDVPRHLWHFSKTSVTKLCAEHDMEVIKTLPMYFDAFYVSLLSEKYKTGRMNVFKAGYVGFLSNMKAYFGKGAYSSLIYCIKHKNSDFKAL